MLLSVRLGKIHALQLAASNNPPLMVGQTGVGVAAIQDLLRDLGYDFPISYRKGKADGIFGAETKGNVEAYQRDAGLKPDGIVGRMTLAKLDELIVKNNILEEHKEAEVAFCDVKNRSLPMNRRTRVAT
jgi:peptidoglycan hydrolase-like protein with peptidoglycan-binding domain